MRRYAAGGGDPAARRAILTEHARLSSSGVPLRCSPTAYERQMRERYKNPIVTQDKVIYDTADKAAAAAAAFAALDGSQPGKVYACTRSKRGHCHITTPYPTSYRSPFTSFNEQPWRR